MSIEKNHQSGDTCPPSFQRIKQSAPFYVAWLPSVKTLKIQKQIENSVSVKISRSKFQNLPEEHAPGPLADLHLGNAATLNLIHHAKCFVVSLRVLLPDKPLNLTSRNLA